jgi:TonB-dependent SusC/RagA subfamily outer membrane receptor
VYPFNSDAMKKSTFQLRSLLVTLMTLLLSAAATAQDIDYAAHKEKIYIQTSHVFFKPGEQVFFKIYVVNARSQTPSRQSMSVYTEITSPSGTIVQKHKYKIDDGFAEGSFDFNEQSPGGVYKIRAYTTWMQNETEATYFTKEITLQGVIAPRVLMKLDFIGKAYGPGDEVSASFSMRNLADMPVRDYAGKFAVSVGGEVIRTLSFTTDHEGKATIRFALPKILKTNDGLLNITVDYDSYTESISRSIPIVLNRIDLQFMPEGGTLVEGIPTWIAFKALNENGKAADVKGDVWDNAGNKVASFESYHFGMGKFQFTPKHGVSYKVKLTAPASISSEFYLPKATTSGVVMNMSKNGDDIHLVLKTNEARQVKLEGRSRDELYYSTIIDLKSGESSLTIDENLFPGGIAQFSIFDNKNLPLAERLCFLHGDRNLRVSINTDKTKYLPREKVKMTILTTDEKGKAIPSNLSLSVMDDKLWTFADDKQDHILSWLLMSSELRGKIEEPQFYFKKEEAKATPALDLVMMTHGYRYFYYIDVVQNQGKLKFFAEQERTLSGKIVDASEKPVKANILLINATDQRNAVSMETNDDGVFYFSELTPGLDYYLLAQSVNKKQKVNIRILQNGVGYNPMNIVNYRSRTLEKDMFGQGFVARYTPAPRNMKLPALAKEGKQKWAAGLMAADNFGLGFEPKAELSEVVVTGYGTVRNASLTGAMLRVRTDELSAMNLTAPLQGKVAGLNVITQGNPAASPNVLIRGVAARTGNSPLVVMDGLPMEELNIANINPNDISSVTILKDASATAIWGNRGANGVIVIDTKQFRDGDIRFKFSNDDYFYTSQKFRASGPIYDVAKSFYVPLYSTTEVEERTDFRETIYWNPVVSTDENGKAQVEFFNSDASTVFRAVVEGIGYNGNAGRMEATYATQNALSLDAKIPPYLTVGDKALLPVVIKNNRDTEMKISLNVNAPDQMKIGRYINDFTLRPDSSRQVLIPVEALSKLKGQVEFEASCDGAKEKIVLPIVASGKGFPVNLVFAGNQSNQYQFPVNKPIPGSINANLRVFKDLEGQLLDGIESMLREPGGCFEQTSSSLYPNIYVLKYLRTAGKSNPEIETKAMGYIERGYKRLLGFETKQNGFEWFGNAPGHEALTAYGLLEFTDMQEFLNVDKQMLERTKKFLLERRDGNGGFTIASGGYDRFASVPHRVANVYIVYALTQAGIGKEIQKEYAAAVKQALQSNDGYQLSMMALAAHNMMNMTDYNALMVAANEQYVKTKLKSETSVTNSRESSLRVETLSLYALALMRNQQCEVAAISPIISSILAEKNYYGYGATQATVLALQAIVEYSRLAQKIDLNSQMLFTLNDAKTDNRDEVSSKLSEGNNSFGVVYSKDGAGIPYSLEVAYHTFTPPNSEKAELKLNTRIANAKPKIGETTRMEIEITNDKNMLQAMSIAKIGIPAGLSAQPWQLKEIMEKKQVAYYEIFDNYLVLYWMGFSGKETKKINLDLKAEIAGTYKAKASNTYLYYMPEHKHWNDGIQVEVLP